MVQDKAGNSSGMSRFSVDDEGIYSICGLIENETYTVSLMKFVELSSGTIPKFDYQPLTFTYDSSVTTLPDLKVTVTEVKI